jgi:hypothetical protein
MHTGAVGRGGRGHLMYPFKKMDHKNAIKHKNRGPPHIFSHNPKYPPQKNLIYVTCKLNT